MGFVQRFKNMRTPIRITLLATIFSSGMVVAFTSGHLAAELNLGDSLFPSLRIWDFEDRVQDPKLYISNFVDGPEQTHSTFLYSLIPEGTAEVASPLSTAIRMEGGGEGVGAFFYSENDGNGIAFGLNAIASTYSGSPAVGIEVNAINNSGNHDALVRGMDIVSYGNTPTQWGIGIHTANSQPQSKAKIGIILAGKSYGNNSNPASDSGLIIDHIDSGEAIQIQEDEHITLDGRIGEIKVKYNSSTDSIEFLKGEVVKFSIPMG